MLSYDPGTTFAHRLDPRSKLLFQAGFAVAVFTVPDPIWLIGLTGLAALTLVVARLSPVDVLWTFRLLVVLLAVAPLFAAVGLGPLRFDADRALDSALAGYRVVLVLLVSSAYVRSTPVRETRAAIQRHVPGRSGQLLGVGVGLVFRLVPVLVADLRRGRDAIRARGGEARSVIDRTRRLSLIGLRRAFRRAERLSLALRARCFAWNPTLPALRFAPADYPVLVAGLVLLASPLL